jgi:hypothetical protein
MINCLIRCSRALQRLSPGAARATVALELEPYRLISVHDLQSGVIFIRRW